MLSKGLFLFLSKSFVQAFVTLIFHNLQQVVNEAIKNDLGFLFASQA